MADGAGEGWADRVLTSPSLRQVAVPAVSWGWCRRGREGKKSATHGGGCLFGAEAAGYGGGGGSRLIPVGPERWVSMNLHLRWMPRAQPGGAGGHNEAPCHHPRHPIDRRGNRGLHPNANCRRVEGLQRTPGPSGERARGTVPFQARGHLLRALGRRGDEARGPPPPPRPEPHRSLPLAATLAWRAQPHPLDFAADSLLREAPIPLLSQGPHLCSPRPSLSLPHHSVVLSFVSCPAPALDIRCPWKDGVQLTPGTPAHLKVSLTSSGPHGMQGPPARRGAASELQDQRTPLCSSL